ncbi:MULTISPECIES: zinc-binding alcohol dehydrogenase family protein [unclassified Rhizobium]|uniref:quinone oxidoreductase family protein n=1 Tax=unclassified Rhizobium TaxID=2613769 RepID=UPI000EA8E180|nr:MULTISPECIES: zinc-binding alcohol dehydrogenase family protein [unclassified Rhizobium]AYG69381.1 zinc-binding alcohol dehydrogenase family protein [Rhizobium sp. CCGE531]AYG75762.1 zinc-binding alcohol dehydrogenase family protein [Rhizobium sp. CCGE532]
MKAAILNNFGEPLTIEDVPDPTLGTGEVIVEVAAAPVLSYADEVFSGARRYPMPTPMVPGCGAVGKVRQVGPDATKLKPGDWVFCDPTVRSRDDALMPDIVLQGWSARGEGGARLQHYYRDGAFAERIRVPTENAIPIGDIDSREAGQWCAIIVLLVAYGGLLAMNFRPGETLLVSGATGNFGSATVATALAMGARAVLAPGRNVAALDRLERLFGPRLITVRLSGDPMRDTDAMKEAAPAPIDAVLDFLPPSVPAHVARAGIMAVRPYGRAVLMGGIGMLGGEELSLPYPWIMRNNITIQGQWMYSPEAVTSIVGLVRGGMLDLGLYKVSEFDLHAANEAVEHAAANGGPFKLTVLRTA